MIFLLRIPKNAMRISKQVCLWRLSPFQALMSYIKIKKKKRLFEFPISRTVYVFNHIILQYMWACVSSLLIHMNKAYNEMKTTFRNTDDTKPKPIVHHSKDKQIFLRNPQKGSVDLKTV